MAGLHFRRRYRHFHRRLQTRSRRLVRSLALHMEWLISAWLALFGLAAGWRIVTATVPLHGALDLIALFLPYALAALAPIAGYRITMAAFPPGHLPAATSIRFARVGSWRRIDALRAHSHPQFGPFGFMASLLVGMLLNIPVRSIEFLLAVPAVNAHGPNWAIAIFRLMALDLVAMNFLYAVVFTMALRTAPLFPRMLLFVWSIDLLAQLFIARQVAAFDNLPVPVATAMEDLLTGNVHKVLISVLVWIPYLLLSRRVNVTYRNRVEN